MLFGHGSYRFGYIFLCEDDIASSEIPCILPWPYVKVLPSCHLYSEYPSKVFPGYCWDDFSIVLTSWIKAKS